MIIFNIYLFSFFLFPLFSLKVRFCPDLHPITWQQLKVSSPLGDALSQPFFWGNQEPLRHFKPSNATWGCRVVLPRGHGAHAGGTSMDTQHSKGMWGRVCGSGGLGLGTR